jgi:hypothetical protein
VLLVAQSPGEPTSAEWSRYLDDIRALPFKDVLVVGEGNKLTAKQRSDVEHLLKRSGGRIAVVTNSPLTRGVMTALAWLGLPARAFALTDLPGALAFLDVAPEHQSEALDTIRRLRAELLDPRTGATTDR